MSGEALLRYLQAIRDFLADDVARHPPASRGGSKFLGEVRSAQRPCGQVFMLAYAGWPASPSGLATLDGRLWRRLT